MQRFLSLLIALVLVMVGAPHAAAQCDEAADACETLLVPFNSTGQYYRAQLFEGESARLKLTFYRGMVYRVVPCSAAPATADAAAPPAPKLIVSLYDRTGKMLYSNENQGGEPYVDLSFGATSSYTLVARYGQGSGCAAVVVGYKSESGSAADDDY